MTQEVVTRIKLDTSSIPGAAAQAQRAIGGIATSAQVSAGQTRNAIRQLPAQFTDIATQLAGGQSIGLVLLQQGGQIRDAFGSIGGALRGIGSFITPLNVAFGAAAAAVGGLAAAYRAASNEQDAITRGLVLSGNAAGTTSGQINDLARAQDALVGTRSQAAQALTQLASSGRVYGAQLAAASEAAVRLALVGGPAIEETARKFIDLGKAPLQALARINEQENIFTASLVRQVAELQRQGREAEAAALAQQAYADGIVARSREVDNSLGTLQRAWQGVAGFAREAWDAMLNIGRPDTLGQQLDRVVADISALQNRLALNRASGFGDANPYGLGSPNAGLESQIGALRQRQAELQELQRLQRRQADIQRASAEEARRTLAQEQEADRARGGPRGRTRNAIGDAEDAVFDRIERWREANENALDRVEEQERATAARRLQEQDTFIVAQLDANARANAELISDDTARARALVDLERDLAQRRIEALFEAGERRRLAEQQADQARELALQLAEKRREEEDKKREERRIQSLENTLGGVLLAGFEGRFDDIGKAWERLLLQMAAKAAAQDLIALLFGRGEGGNLANLFGTVLGALGLGGRAGGGSVNARSAFLVGEQGPEVLVMGGRGGTIVPNAQLSGGGGASFAPVTYVTIDSRTDAAQVAQVAAQAVRTSQEGMWQQLRARGLV